MCDYCDCRDIGPIGELGAEHDECFRLMAAIRSSLASGDRDAAAASFSVLQLLLVAHLDLEERGIFTELARFGGWHDYLAELSTDHAYVRAELLRVDSATAEPALLLEMLDALKAHVQQEEYDLFPASRLALDDSGWARIAAVHGSARTTEEP